jgi:DNA-directed RNA polymerase specialized sigma24 family protein
MKEQPVVDNPVLKRDWQLTHGAFHRMLDWLDDGADSGGQRYLEMRRRLVLYFDRKNCTAPDDLADETLNRVARRLEEEGAITSDGPAHYCYTVARFVFLEHLRRQGKEVSLDGAPEGRAAIGQDISASRSLEDPDDERRTRCLERCAAKLTPEQRDLIIKYYTGERRAKLDNRKAIAAALGITSNALSIRACRIRDKLEACVRKCLDET